MSVRKGDRSESKLEVLNDCRILAEYTIQICRNEKIFPKSSRWIMSKRILDECLEAISCIRRANAVYVGDKQSFKLNFEFRYQQQMQAHAHLDTLLTLVDLAYNTYNIEGRKIEYWTGLILEADDKLKAWMKADKERYNNIG